MLSIYRRHRSTCPHKADRISKRCRCALWVKGTLEGAPYQRSLKTRSFERGDVLKRQIEDGKKPKDKGITIKEAVTRLIADAEARNLNTNTIAKYKLLGTRLQDFATGEGIGDLRKFGNDQVVAFRASWKGSPRTLSKTLERFKSWFNFFLQNGWITVNPTRGIKAPEVRPSPTLPFTDDELSKIFAKAEGKTRTFFKVLLHSGLRIIDAATLRPERIENGKLFLYQQKTGVAVRVPLPPDLLIELSKLPLVGGFYFVVESEKPESIAEHYRVRLTIAAEKAGLIPKKEKGKKRKNVIHPHRFRDTFAVRLLEKGVSLETVSILLGHTDIKTTQKSYAPWVQSLQANLELAVQKTWAKAQLALVKR